MEGVYVGLGANLGAARQTLAEALRELGELPSTRVIKASSFYASAPLDAQGPDYVNAVAELSTALQPHELLQLRPTLASLNVGAVRASAGASVLRERAALNGHMRRALAETLECLARCRRPDVPLYSRRRRVRRLSGVDFGVVRRRPSASTCGWWRDGYAARSEGALS